MEASKGNKKVFIKPLLKRKLFDISRGSQNKYNIPAKYNTLIYPPSIVYKLKTKRKTLLLFTSPFPNI